MSTTEKNLDRIAEYFFGQEKQIIPFEEALRALDIFNLEMSRTALRAAMAMRGLAYANGEITIAADMQRAIPAKVDYAPFIQAAKAAVDMAVKPIPTGELIGMSGLVTEAIPGELPFYLRSAGVYFIPGAGYWKYPQYASDHGELFCAPNKSRRITLLMETFSRHGWPLAGQEIETLTGGAVTSRFCSTKSAAVQRHCQIRAIAHGLFSPIGAEATLEMPIPITKNIAEDILGNLPSEPIFFKEKPRMYKIAEVLAAHGMATVSYKWLARNGYRQRARYMELTEQGYKMLRGLDRRLRKDEF